MTIQMPMNSLVLYADVMLWLKINKKRKKKVSLKQVTANRRTIRINQITATMLLSPNESKIMNLFPLRSQIMKI